jgi:hypothetical protein
MTWAILHKSSEEFASAAHEAVRQGNTREAKSLFEQAAAAQKKALFRLDIARKQEPSE